MTLGRDWQTMVTTTLKQQREMVLVKTLGLVISAVYADNCKLFKASFTKVVVILLINNS